MVNILYSTVIQLVVWKNYMCVFSQDFTVVSMSNISLYSDKDSSSMYMERKRGTLGGASRRNIRGGFNFAVKRPPRKPRILIHREYFCIYSTPSLPSARTSFPTNFTRLNVIFCAERLADRGRKFDWQSYAWNIGYHGDGVAPERTQSPPSGHGGNWLTN